MRKFINASIVTVLIFTGFQAQPAIPSKSGVCILALNEIATSDPLRKTSPVYTLNTLGALREHGLKYAEIRGDIPEGFASSKENSFGFNDKDVAARISGIEVFGTQKEGEVEGTRNFTKILVLTGQENIQDFLQRFQSNYTWAARQVTKDLLKAYKGQIGINLFLLANINWGRLAHVDSILIAALSGLAALEVMWGVDHLAQRPFHKDYFIDEYIKKMFKILSSTDEKYWALLSRNALIKQKFVSRASNGTKNDSEIADIIYSQNLIEAPPLLAKIMLAKEKFKKDWVGMDFYLEKQPNQEPELHVIVRGSEKLPQFPNVSKKKSRNDTSELQWAPGLQPATIPSR